MCILSIAVWGETCYLRSWPKTKFGYQILFSFSTDKDRRTDSQIRRKNTPLGRGGPNLVAAHDHRHQTLVVLQLPPPSPSRRALPLSPRFPTIVGIRSTVNRQPGDLPQLQFSHLFRPSMPPCPHLPVLRRKAPTIQVLP